MTAAVTEAGGWDDDSRAVLERVQRAATDADGTDPLDEAALRRLRTRGLDGARLWTAGDAGFALVHDGALDLVVDPARRRQGLGRALADAVAASVGSDSPHTAWSHGDHPAAAALAAAHGWQAVRALWVLRRPADRPLPDLPPPPEGVALRSFDDADAAEVLRVNAAAFAHHPEQGAMDDADFAARRAEPWFDPAGLILATSGERVLGFHWTKRVEEVGEVYVVGIDPAAQGRGLGTLLTLAGLHHLAAAGDLREVILYVESDNRPALAVYEKLGFTHAPTDTHVQYAPRLTEAPARSDPRSRRPPRATTTRRPPN